MPPRRRAARPDEDEGFPARPIEDIGEDFERTRYVTTQGGAPPRSSPANVQSYENAITDKVARRVLLGMTFERAAQGFILDDTQPTPTKRGGYSSATFEMIRSRGWDGIIGHGLKHAPFFYGYDRLGDLGPESLDVSELSSIQVVGGVPVFTETGAFVPPPVGVVIPSNSRTLSVRFRVHNPFLSRVIVRLRNPSSNADGGETGYVKVWISRGIQPATAVGIPPGPPFAQQFHSGADFPSAVTPVIRVPITQIRSYFQDFQFPLYAILETIKDIATPTEEDTYQLNLQADDGLSVEAEVVTAIVGPPDTVVPRFKVYTFGTGGAAPGGGPGSALYTRASVYQKYFAQRSLNPGTAPPPAGLFTLPDGTSADAVLLPTPLRPPAPVPPPPGDAGTDFTPSTAVGPNTVEFWEALRKTTLLLRGQQKGAVTFVVAGAATITSITVAIIRNTGAGTTVVASKTFGALALAAGMHQFVIYPELAADATFGPGDAFGYRVSWTQAGGVAGNTQLNHARGSDETHLEAVINA